jgi:hypothetical protein
MDMFARYLRVDRQDAIAMVLKDLHDMVAGAVGTVGDADQGDGAGFVEQGGDVLRGGQRHGFSPLRLGRNRRQRRSRR